MDTADVDDIHFMLGIFWEFLIFLSSKYFYALNILTPLYFMTGLAVIQECIYDKYIIRACNVCGSKSNRHHPFIRGFTDA